MDVLKGRDIEKTIVLGSGMSILDLSAEEKAYINRCQVVIAVNKYMAFYKKSGILPTHVYFTDKLGNSYEMFKHILRTCINDNLENLTFVTNKFNFDIRIQYPASAIRAGVMLYLYKAWSFYKRYAKPKIFTNTDMTRLKQKGLGIKYPTKSTVIGVNVSNYLKGGDWAKTFAQPMFHFRGSLTTVLNICSIVSPNREIYLIGNDFNGSSYFYEKELDELNFEWKDYTYELVKKGGMHFSFQEVQGKKMEDVFPFILKSLAETGNQLYCNNPDSMLVTSAGVAVKSLMAEVKGF